MRYGLFYWSAMLLAYLILADSTDFNPSATFAAFVVALFGFIGVSIARVRNEDIDVFDDAMVSRVGVSLAHPYPHKVTKNELDYRRSCHRTRLDRITMNYKVYSNNGKGFSIKRYLYSRTDFKRIQDNLLKIYGLDFW
jgi:hypothetical protein